MGKIWLIGPTRPSVAITAVRPRISGTPAATSAPKATIRMISVIGRESVSARLKSSSSEALSALPALASPNCSMRRSGWAFWAAAIVASDVSTRSSARLSSPGMENVISAERPSLENWPSLPLARGLSTLVTYLVSFRRLVVSLTASVKLASVALPSPLA